ncbi:MAG: [Oscillospiraceae bacterium]|nr:[FeFe] hydrogenase H-cluster maturation GTPase HydF [Oscillospiraceae bacterium]
MAMNNTPAAERVHIGFFGRRNAGKSSVVNAVTGQELAIVSDVLGTTTDPVYKSMELLPMGPVMIIDTPGIDDEGELGQMRVRKSYQVLNKTDVAVLVVDSSAGLSAADEQLIETFKKKELRYVIAWNKADLGGASVDAPADGIAVSAKTGAGIHELKERIAALAAPEENPRRIVADLVETGDLAVLVVPIDKAAPKGRLILPQQQTIRDLLDAGAAAVVTRDTELKETLKKLGEKPRIVITDSQAFGRVSRDVPEDILLTSFSILFARYKGDLEAAVRGAAALENVKAGDKILIAEGCTHHRQCGDIGTEKLPNWIRKHLGCEPQFTFTSGTEFPEDLSEYKLIVHCGGCMLNEREMKYRLSCAADQGTPMTNYGILIAYMNGILARSVRPFPAIHALLEK